jgi:hypothetical protein
MDEYPHDLTAQGYIEHKASRMAEEGLGERAVAWLRSGGEGLVAVVLDGLRQIQDGCGFSEEQPLTGIGISGFHRMMAILGFRCRQQSLCSMSEEGMLDRMVMQHKVTEMVARMYNLVERPLPQRE